MLEYRFNDDLVIRATSGEALGGTADQDNVEWCKKLWDVLDYEEKRIISYFAIFDDIRLTELRLAVLEEQDD